MNISAASIIFILTIIVSGIVLAIPNLLNKFSFIPYNVIHKNQWYRFLTSGITHVNLTHLLFNMFTFYFFSFDLEKTIGEINFIWIYIGSMLFSHIPTLIKYRNNINYSSLGASGAISGVIFSSILIYPTNSMMIMPIPIPIPAFIFGICYIIWCIAANNRNTDNINHSAHLAGAIAGIIITFVLFGEQIIKIWQQML